MVKKHMASPKVAAKTLAARKKSKVARKEAKPDTVRDDIHAILNEYDGEEALRRIRELLYGPPVDAETPDE